MINNHIKTFSTGEFANLFGVKKDTLLYYNKINLFNPAGIHSNGYRYYTLPQLDTFSAIQSLRSVNFPINDLKSYFESPSVPKLNELASRQVENIENEINKLKENQLFLSRLIEVTNELKNVIIGELILKELPAESVLFSSSKNIDWEASVEDLSHIYDEFLKEVGVNGAAAFGSVLNKKNLLSENFLQADCLFCRMEGPGTTQKPAGLYAIYYYQGSYDNIKIAYSYLLKEIAFRKLTIDGDAYEEYLLHSLVSKHEEEYITKISIKVKL
ncbi:MerR family transcriptional regulator [Bacillus sp. Au-Bac7]|uniref:MerR family transcriptional regulator n=1 Tax=Bacillus sp. Au-Bac7 TaxID=2906458 RepID=UPI001E298A46|nr:MerR family transcriptional regulator [Bacillus sp. Au-Bac7]MCE4051012.1 MerR family transcriptional regulator [Bacillus sp. Au-Bac7]